MTIKILFLARERSELLYVSIRSKYLILDCYNYFRQVCNIKWPKLNMYRFDGKWKSIFNFLVTFSLIWNLNWANYCFRRKVEEGMWWKLKSILRIGCQWINETRNAINQMSTNISELNLFKWKISSEMENGVVNWRKNMVRQIGGHGNDNFLAGYNSNVETKQWWWKRQQRATKLFEVH